MSYSKHTHLVYGIAFVFDTNSNFADMFLSDEIAVPDKYKDFSIIGIDNHNALFGVSIVSTSGKHDIDDQIIDIRPQEITKWTSLIIECLICYGVEYTERLPSLRLFDFHW